MQATQDNAQRIIVTAPYEEKQQGLVDTMLCTWSDLSTYNDVYRNINKLTPAQEVEVAQAILHRREDTGAL